MVSTGFQRPLKLLFDMGMKSILLVNPSELVVYLNDKKKKKTLWLIKKTAELQVQKTSRYYRHQEGSGRLRLVIYVYINDDSLLGKVMHD